MKFLFFLPIVLVALCSVSCDDRKKGDGVETVSKTQPASPTKAEDLYDEVWMMRGWQGYMCVVLAIKGDRCDQWFFSDVGYSVDQNQPLTCQVFKTDTGIRLSSESPDRLYSARWDYVEKNGETYLASVDDIRAGRDDERWLKRVNVGAFIKYLDTGGPFVLHMNPQLDSEQGTESGR